MKGLYWVGACLSDIRAFPDDARHEVGTDLRRIQHGLEPRDWKPMPTLGKGAREARVRGREAERMTSR